MLHFAMFAALAAAQPTAAVDSPSPTADQASLEAIINQAMGLQAKDNNEDLKLLAAQLKAMANQKQHLRDMLQEIVREQERVAAGGPIRVHPQQDWAVQLPSLCPPGRLRADCLERQLRTRLDMLKASSRQR